MDIQIRKAQIEDVGEIIDLNQQLFDYDYKNFDKTLNCHWPQENKDYFKKSITEENFLALVAVADNKIVGYLIGSITKAKDYRIVKQIAEADNSFILPKYRKKGIGTDFMNQFIDWARKKGIKRIKLVTSAGNKPMINMAKKLNFTEYTLTLEKEL